MLSFLCYYFETIFVIYLSILLSSIFSFLYISYNSGIEMGYDLVLIIFGLASGTKRFDLFSLTTLFLETVKLLIYCSYDYDMCLSFILCYFIAFFNDFIIYGDRYRFYCNFV